MYMRVGASWYDVRPLLERRVVDLDPEYVQRALAAPRANPFAGVSPKGVGTYRRELEREIAAAALRVGGRVDRRAYDAAKKAWQRYRAAMADRFQGLVAQLAAKEITKNQFIARARILFKAGYEYAFQQGSRAAGLSFVELSASDRAWLARARSHEYTFLGRFADDIVAGRGSMPYSERASLYVRTIDSTFDAGRVASLPEEGTRIWWMLGASAEPCGDCIELAFHSPYTPGALPTTPGAGDTACLAYCNCSLRVRYSKPRPPAPAPRVADGGRLEGLRIDFNALDDAVSALALKSTAYLAGDAWREAWLRLRAAELFERACRKLPLWLDPLSRDLLKWQKLGTIVLAQNAAREGWHAG